MQSLSRPILRASVSTPFLRRTITSTSCSMGAGDTGSPKARGSLAEKDQFQRREAASEAMYIRQLEMEKIDRLRKKMKESQDYMKELDKHLEEYAKSQGGEQN